VPLSTISPFADGWLFTPLLLPAHAPLRLVLLLAPVQPARDGGRAAGVPCWLHPDHPDRPPLVSVAATLGERRRARGGSPAQLPTAAHTPARVLAARSAATGGQSRWQQAV
jgi:hypothetical protein